MSRASPFGMEAVLALNWQYRGFDYTSYYNGAFENDDSLSALDATGANAVGTTLDWGINTRTNTVYADSSYTDPLSAEAAVIREAVAKGLQVMVKPTIDFLNTSDAPGYSIGEWRTYYNPGAAGSTGATSFFASYKTMILQEAAVAAANGATIFCIGTELDQIAGPAYKSQWDSIISAIRAQDPGLKLTYAADWNDAASPWAGVNGLKAGTGDIATQISFAGELDYLGLDVYAPLSDAAKPTLQQLIDGWLEAPADSGATAETYAVTGGQSLVQYFDSVAKEAGKPLLFTEVGFENATDAASSPAVSQTNAEDDALQARLYQSLFDAYSQSGDTAISGAFLYNWDPNASEVGPGSVAFSPQNLPALAAVDAAFAAPTVSAAPTVDSRLNAEVAAPGLSLGAGSTGSVFTVKLTAAEGLLFATGSSGAQVTGSGSAALTVAGGLGAVNTTLATLQYEATASANDTIHVSASADGGPVGTGTIAVAYEPPAPVLSFSTVSLVSGATVDVAGTVGAADAGRPVTCFVNGKAAGTSLAQANGTFSVDLTLPTNAVAVVSASLTDAFGQSGATGPLMIGVGDGLTATFSAANGNVVDLFNATSQGDTVNGSNGYVIDYGSKATINGGGDQVYTDGSSADALTLTGTGAATDSVFGSDMTLALSHAQANVSGGGNNVIFSSGPDNVVNIESTGSAFDTLTSANGATGTVNLVGAALAHIGAGVETGYFVTGYGQDAGSCF